MRDLYTALQALVGKELSSVEFVRGSVQLRFDGPVITVLTPLSVVAGAVLRSGSPGFCDALVARVGSRLIAAAVDDDALTLELDDHAKLVAPLRSADHRGAEAVTYDDGIGGIWVA